MSGTGSSASNVISFRFQASDAAPAAESAGIRVGGRLNVDRADGPANEGVLDLRSVLIDSGGGRLNDFVSLSDNIRKRLEACIELIDGDDLFAADNELMLASRECQRLFLFRDISESVGLVSLKIIQAAAAIGVTTRSPKIIKIIVKSLNAIASSPYMTFDQASLLADDIEGAAGQLRFAGYGDLIGALIE